MVVMPKGCYEQLQLTKQIGHHHITLLLLLLLFLLFLLLLLLLTLSVAVFFSASALSDSGVAVGC